VTRSIFYDEEEMGVITVASQCGVKRKKKRMHVRHEVDEEEMGHNAPGVMQFESNLSSSSPATAVPLAIATSSAA
jgi:hypothetical protein